MIPLLDEAREFSNFYLFFFIFKVLLGLEVLTDFNCVLNGYYSLMSIYWISEIFCFFTLLNITSSEEADTKLLGKIRK